MSQFAGIQFKRENAAGLAVVLALHSLLLYALMQYHIIPPPSEALTVFVSYINPAAPARITPPETPKPVQPAPLKQEVQPNVIPTAPKILTSETPVKSPTEPVAPPPPAVKTPPVAVAVSSPVVSRQAVIPPPAPVALAAAQPLQLGNELSVSCPERTPPAYPKQSLRLGEQGKTVLLVELDELGHVARVDVKTKSGFPRLDEAAVNAVKTWRCSPAKRNGIAVRSVASQPFNFTLPKGR